MTWPLRSRVEPRQPRCASGSWPLSWWRACCPRHLSHPTPRASGNSVGAAGHRQAGHKTVRSEEVASPGDLPALFANWVRGRQGRVHGDPFHPGDDLQGQFKPELALDAAIIGFTRRSEDLAPCAAARWDSCERTGARKSTAPAGRVHASSEPRRCRTRSARGRRGSRDCSGPVSDRNQVPLPVSRPSPRPCRAQVNPVRRPCGRRTPRRRW